MENHWNHRGRTVGKIELCRRRDEWRCTCSRHIKCNRYHGIERRQVSHAITCAVDIEWSKSRIKSFDRVPEGIGVPFKDGVGHGWTASNDRPRLIKLDRVKNDVLTSRSFDIHWKRLLSTGSD